jgi:serine protease Do
MSGKTYPARLVGSDSEANLALLQLSGTGFRPVAIGTTADIHLNDRVASAGGTWTARALTLSTGSITGIGVPVTLDGQRLTGLLEVSSLAAPASELGGPLFNLSGQVLGLSVGYGTSQGTADGYVVPIDSALLLARQIAGQ